MKEYIMIISIHADSALAPGYRDWGGTNVYMRELMEGLVKLNIPFVFITRKVFKELPDIEKISDTGTIYRIKSGEEKLIDKNTLKQFHETHLEQIIQIINHLGRKPSVIHSVYWNSGRLAAELCDIYNINYVHSVISNDLGRIARGAKEMCEGRSTYEKHVYEKALCILAVSKDEKNDLVNYYNISPNKIIVAGQEVNSSFLFPSHDANNFPKVYSKISSEQQKQIAERENILHVNDKPSHWWNYKAFTYMGRLSYNKGVPIIIKAWYEIYLDYGINCPPLWIIGGSIEEIEDVRSKLQIHDLDVLEKQQKLVWWGYLDANGISTLLLKSLVLIMHSMYEPGGRVAVEAMSEGIPVIATNRGFGADYIKDCENGFCVEYGNVNQLRNRMELFLRQPLLSNCLGLKAKECANEIINEWDFLYAHCNAYIDAGYHHHKYINTNRNDTPSTQNYFRKRRISVYPYINIRISDKIVGDFVKENVNRNYEMTRVNPKDSTSELWQITLDNNDSYLVKHFETRLSLNTLYNPFQKDVWVRNATSLIKREAYWDKQLQFNHILFADYNNNLLLMKNCQGTDLENSVLNITAIIDLLKNTQRHLPDNSKTLFVNLNPTKKTDYNSISKLIQSYEDTFPYCYGIDASGCQSISLAWSMLPYILDYNSNYISSSLMKKLKNRFIPIFQNQCEEEYKLPISYIHGDMKFNHIVWNSNKLELIDNEKGSIGYIGYDIATMLLRYHRKGYSWEQLLKVVPNEYIPRKILISRIAYIIVYDGIVNSLLGTQNSQLSRIVEELIDLL